MANEVISEINFGGTNYSIKDAEARQDIAGLKNSVTGGMHYVGTTNTKLTNGSTTSTLTQAKEGDMRKLTGFVAGDLVIYGDLEFVWNGSKWAEFGSTGSLKGLAFKDSASGNLTPEGSVGVVVDNGTSNYTPSGKVKHAVKSTDNALGENTTFSNAESSVSLAGGSTSKLVTTSVPNVTSAGQMFEASVVGETLVLTPGSAPTIGAPITVATGNVANDASGATVATALHTGGTAAAQKITVGTNDKVAAITEMNEPSFEGTGVRISASFTGKEKSVTVS